MGTNTSIGIANGIGFKSKSSGGGSMKPPLPPHVKDNLVGVWDCYGKTNTDSDRAVIKNKIRNRGGDLKLSNFSFKEGSGYGGKRGIISITMNVGNIFKDVTKFRFTVVKGNILRWSSHYNYTTITDGGLASYIIKITGLTDLDDLRLIPYNRESSEFVKLKNGINKVSITIPDIKYPYTVIHSSGALINDVTIEYLEEFPNALVTDGVNDFIESEKTILDMLEGGDITVVSMIHQISLSAPTAMAFTNYICSTSVAATGNHVTNIAKTGIYGFKGSDTIISILGDKNDYNLNRTGTFQISDRFSVLGAKINGNIERLSQVAYYWTFIAKTVLTEDEIDLIILYYNLDKMVEPIEKTEIRFITSRD